MLSQSTSLQSPTEAVMKGRRLQASVLLRSSLWKLWLHLPTTHLVEGAERFSQVFHFLTGEVFDRIRLRYCHSCWVSLPLSPVGKFKCLQARRTDRFGRQDESCRGMNVETCPRSTGHCRVRWPIVILLHVILLGTSFKIDVIFSIQRMLSTPSI